jgi:cell division protein FtsQ
MSLDTILTRRRGAPRVLPRRRPRLPARLLALLLAAAVVLGGGWMWLRDSSLARVRDVTVTGATTSEQGRVRDALESAAAGMSTLHVRMDRLREAVSPYASVADLRVRTHFPHRMTIEVVPREPVAVLEVAGREEPVSGSGLILNGVAPDSDLPVIKMAAPPAGDHVDNAHTMVALRIAADAPAVLRHRILRLWTGARGMQLALENGPDLIFGDDRDDARRWAAAARVLAEPSAAGATYLDVRIPDRVAAGGLGPVAEPTPEPTPETNLQP